jgi:hypothetical protein
MALPRVVDPELSDSKNRSIPRLKAVTEDPNMIPPRGIMTCASQKGSGRSTPKEMSARKKVELMIMASSICGGTGVSA